MRPGQNNKRLRGRNGRKGPNPLTRSYESNGPDVKIRGTAQHVAEKYLQLARDAQSSGDTIMAESLLQHAEHYFRLIAGAQAQQQGMNGGFGRSQGETELDLEDEDDFSGMSDRFAPLSERLPPVPAFNGPGQQPYQQAGQPQGHFPPSAPALAAPQPQPQPFEERPIGGEQQQPRHERQQQRHEPRHERQFNRDRNRDGGERPHFERPRERRFPPRVPQSAMDQPEPREIEAAIGLPAFITAPTPVPRAEPEPPFVAQERPTTQQAAGENGEHLASRRRRRPRPPLEDAQQPAEANQETGELPLGD